MEGLGVASDDRGADVFIPSAAPLEESAEEYGRFI